MSCHSSSGPAGLAPRFDAEGLCQKCDCGRCRSATPRQDDVSRGRMPASFLQPVGASPSMSVCSAVMRPVDLDRRRWCSLRIGRQPRSQRSVSGHGNLRVNLRLFSVWPTSLEPCDSRQKISNPYSRAQRFRSTNGCRAACRAHHSVDGY